jgi:uncharacterized membrane protein
MATPVQEEIWHKDLNNWSFIGCYYNKEDNRIFVPKRIKWMGITLNFANSKSYFALVLILLFLDLFYI